ncbi:MAG TPA: hypothetical protein VF601_14205 [Beijerinckiaceae bacterium]
MGEPVARDQLNQRSEQVSVEPQVADGIEKIISLMRPSGERADQARQPEQPSKPEWATSLALVHQAAEAMRAGADRWHEVETRAQALLARATKELDAAQRRIAELEARLRASEAVQKKTETRAKEAEDWLRRIHEAIVGELPAGLNLLSELTGPTRTEPSHSVAAE